MGTQGRMKSSEQLRRDLAELDAAVATATGELGEAVAGGEDKRAGGLQERLRGLRYRRAAVEAGIPAAVVREGAELVEAERQQAVGWLRQVYAAMAADLECRATIVERQRALDDAIKARQRAVDGDLIQTLRARLVDRQIELRGQGRFEGCHDPALLRRGAVEFAALARSAEIPTLPRPRGVHGRREHEAPDAAALREAGAAGQAFRREQQRLITELELATAGNEREKSAKLRAALADLVIERLGALRAEERRLRARIPELAAIGETRLVEDLKAALARTVDERTQLGGQYPQASTRAHQLAAAAAG